MYFQPTLPGFDDVTFSAALAGGSTPCNSPDGQKMLECGRGRALASHLVLPASERDQQTSGTCGPSSSGLSTPSDRLASSVNKSLQRMLSHGSMEYSLIWKERVTPAQRRICALRASARRTSGKDCTGWPTPQSHDTHEQGKGRELTEAGRIRCHNGNTHSLNLPGVAQLTGWNTPRATDGTNGGPNQSGGALPADAALAGWPTPDANSADRGADHGEGWTRQSGANRASTLNRTAAWTDGATTESSHAATAKPGVLDAAFSRWLMGFQMTHDLSSPHWHEWELIQQALKEPFGSHERIG